MFSKRIIRIFALSLLCLLSPQGVADNESGTHLWDSRDLDHVDSSDIDLVIFRRKPILSTFWSELPVVRVCSDSRVTPARARSAISYWQRLGYDIKPAIFSSENNPICRMGGVRGEITIMLATSDVPMGTNLAVTRTWFTSEKRLVRAQIYIIGGFADRPRLVEHEIGHALGWGHFNRSYHVMHSRYADTGVNSMGLTWREWIAERARITGEAL